MTGHMRAVFPALPLPSIVRLNTGFKLAALLQLAQTEMNCVSKTVNHVLGFSVGKN